MADPNKEISGRDEMNLAEFPMALLAHRAPPGQKTLQHRKTIRGPDGKPIEQTWTLAATDEYGLPVAGDEELFLALLDVSRRQGFPERVSFSRYELMQRMNWRPSGESYRRVLDGLRRLSSVSFFAQNAFWDNSRKRYFKELKFNIIAEYAIADGDRSQPSLPLSWIRWSDPVLTSIRAGNIKALDLGRYFRLETTIARRLYRFLDKKFGNKHTFSIDLFTLAHEHLGMTRSWKYPADIRRRLDPAVDELKSDGYLERCLYKKRDNGSLAVTFCRGSAAPALPSSADPVPEQQDDPADWFVQQLTGAAKACSTDRKAASEFIAAHGNNRFRAFAQFALDWRTENWPDMRTLKGALSACLQPFLDHEADLQRAARQRQEQELRQEWLTAIEATVEPYRREHGDAVMRFESEIGADPEYRKMLSMSDVYRNNGTLGDYATDQARAIRLEAFRARFPDCGVPDFDTWHGSAASPNAIVG